MRLTCIHCGKQFEQKTLEPTAVCACSCGHQIDIPVLKDTGAKPSNRAADKLRFRAFMAAGLVNKNGYYALYCALLSLIFPPLYLVSIILSIIVLSTPAGNLAKYSGHKQAKLALLLGALCCGGAGTAYSASYLSRLQSQRLAWQVTASQDLKNLRFAELSYKDSTNHFGMLSDLAFVAGGFYSICMGEGQFKQATSRKLTAATASQCPTDGFITKDNFKALAIADLDGDGNLDVWSIDAAGNLHHVKNDLQ